MPWFWWLGMAVVIVAVSAAISTGICATIACREAKRNRPVLYKCCEHCGVNYPAAGESYCSRKPDTHREPCNEPGFCTGKELV